MKNTLITIAMFLLSATAFASDTVGDKALVTLSNCKVEEPSVVSVNAVVELNTYSPIYTKFNLEGVTCESLALDTKSIVSVEEVFDTFKQVYMNTKNTRPQLKCVVQTTASLEIAGNFVLVTTPEFIYKVSTTIRGCLE